MTVTKTQFNVNDLGMCSDLNILARAVLPYWVVKHGYVCDLLYDVEHFEAYLPRLWLWRDQATTEKAIYVITTDVGTHIAVGADRHNLTATKRLSKSCSCKAILKVTRTGSKFPENNNIRVEKVE